MRSNLHLVTGHDGQVWLTDRLVEGDFQQTVREILEGDPERDKELLPGTSHAFYRGARTALVLTFPTDVDRAKAEQLVSNIREGREDTN